MFQLQLFAYSPRKKFEWIFPTKMKFFPPLPRPNILCIFMIQLMNNVQTFKR